MTQSAATTRREAPALSPEHAQMVEALRTRAAALSGTELQARIRAAARELDTALEGIAQDQARREAIPNEWTVAQVVDHVAQTTARVTEELRHLAAGRRPPAPPVYEAILSGAARRVPWSELLDGLHASNAEFDAVLAQALAGGDTAGPSPTVLAILVVNRRLPDGREEPDIFPAELGLKEYALVQRLHLLDHRTQVRKLRAALGGLERGLRGDQLAGAGPTRPPRH